MDPVQQYNRHQDNPVDRVPKRQREAELETPTSRFVPRPKMQDSTIAARLNRPKLRITIPKSHSFHLPSIVQLLDQSLKKSLAAHENLPLNDRFILSTDLSADEISNQVYQAYTSDCLALKEFIEEHDSISSDRKAKIAPLLDEESDFVLYGENMAFFGQEALPAIKGIINTIRQINNELQSLEGPDLDEILKTYPLQKEDLKCFDGTLTRLETILAHIKDAQIAAGTRNPDSILQHLDRSLPCQSQLLIRVIEAAAAQCQLSQFIDPGDEIHQNLGLQSRLGVSSTAVQQKDTFAQASVQHIPGPFFYGSILKLLDILRQELNEQLQSPSVIQSLDEFQNQLISTIASNSTSAVDTPEDQLEKAKLLCAQLSEINMSPISPILQEGDVRIEQRYGIWNEDITEIKDWDWSSIVNKLQDYITNEWKLTEMLTSPHVLENKSYDSVINLDLRDVMTSLEGINGSQEQYLAAQYLLAHLENPVQNSGSDAYNRCRVFVMFAQVYLTSPSGSIQSNCTFTQFAQATLCNYKQKSTSQINTQILNNISFAINQTYSSRFPYSITSFDSIRLSYNKEQKRDPLSVQEFTYLFDLDLGIDTLNALAEHHIRWSPETDLQQFQPLLKYVVETADDAIDQKAANFLKIMVQSKPELLSRVLLCGLEHSASNAEPKHNGAYIFLVEGLGRYFPQLLSQNLIHEKYPKLTDSLLIEGLKIQSHGIIENLFKSTHAVSYIQKSIFESEEKVQQFCTDNQISQDIFKEYYDEYLNLSPQPNKVLKALIHNEFW